MNTSWKELARQIDECMHVDIRLIESIGPWGVRIVVDELVPRLYPDNPENDFVPALAERISLQMTTHPQPPARAFEVIFRDCISYMVANETYGRFPEAPEVFDGKLFRFFTHSHLLELTKKTTYATDEHPGPGILRHYEIAGQDDVVDVITTSEPLICLLRNESPLSTGH